MHRVWTGLAAIVLVEGCASSVRTTSSTGVATTTVRTAAMTPPKTGAAWADSILAAMPLRDRVAQLVWPFVLGDYVPEGSAEWARIRRLVSEQHVGGFIVSVGSPLDIASKTNALQELSDLPLLISADMETGAGFRARGGYFLPNAIELGGATSFPWQMALGAIRDTALAYEMAKVTAREARALGIHVVFGPVLDVNNNPANPVIGARSYAEDPVLTARLGAAYVRGLQDNGVLATGKHFPGHGDTETNSHLALAMVNASRSRLDSVELVPFREAVRAGVGAIMTFHGFLPALDSSGVPATLSPLVMSDLLRRDMRFDGLLVTDAMDMAGVVDRFGAVEAAKRAIAAGNDVLLMPSDIPGAIDAVVAGVSEGRYSEDRINASVRRVLLLKDDLGLRRLRTVPLEKVRSVVGDSSHVAIAQTIADRAVVLARDSAALVPLSSNGGTVRSVTYARRTDLGAGTAFNAELRRLGARVVPTYVNADDSLPNLEPLFSSIGSDDIVVLGSYVNISSTTATAGAPPAFEALMKGIRGRTSRVILVSFGSPYALLQAPDAPAYLIAWGGFAPSQRAAARALTGDIGITASLPISIPPLLSIGAGERRAPRPR
ncbi:MAG TPA: glycoside hydrolase family 3 protein [Gemmatimonadaceae bacterium]